MPGHIADPPPKPREADGATFGSPGCWSFMNRCGSNSSTVAPQIDGLQCSSAAGMSKKEPFLRRYLSFSNVSLNTIRPVAFVDFTRRTSCSSDMTKGTPSITCFMFSWRIEVRYSPGFSFSVLRAYSLFLRFSSSDGLEKMATIIQNAVGAVFTRRAMDKPISKSAMSSEGTLCFFPTSYRDCTKREPWLWPFSAKYLTNPRKIFIRLFQALRAKRLGRKPRASEPKWVSSVLSSLASAT